MSADPHTPRISLDEIEGDFLTPWQFSTWCGVSKNGGYELLRQDPYRQAVRHFGRQIRVSKKALARIVEEAP